MAIKEYRKGRNEVSRNSIRIHHLGEGSTVCLGDDRYSPSIVIFIIIILYLFIHDNTIESFFYCFIHLFSIIPLIHKRTHHGT